MTKTSKLDFSRQVEDIRSPVSPDGRLLISAGHTEGQAAHVKGQADAASLKAKSDFGGFLGASVLAAGKGYLEAGAEKEIAGVLGKFDQMAEADIAANNRKVGKGLFDSMASDDYMGGQTVQHFTEEAAKYAEARRQGVIGRDEVIAQIGGVIKKYSAMVPGMASDFRKIGAEMTGISNIDVYGIHKALTTATIAEKAAIKKMELDMALKKEAAAALGKTSIDDLTPEAEAFYRQHKQLGLQTANARNMKENGDIRQGDVDKLNEQLASGYVAQAVAGLASRFSQLHAAHLNSTSPLGQAEALRLGGQVAAEIDVLQATLVSKVQELTIGKSPMSQERADRVIAGIKSNFSTWRDAVKTAEGFNMWTQTIKAAKGNAEYIVHASELAMPHLALLKSTGMLPKMADGWFAMGGDKKKFTAIFGKKSADALEYAFKNNNAYSKAYGLILSGDSNFEDEQKRDPQIATVVYNDVVGNLTDIVKDGSTLRDEQKQPFSNMVAAWLSNPSNTYSNPTEYKKMKELLLSPNMVKVLSQLDPGQKKNALAPLFARVDTTVPKEVANLKTLVEEYNNYDTSKKMGHKASLVFDRVSNSLRIDVVPGNNQSALVAPFNSRGVPMGPPVSPTGHPVGVRAEVRQRELLDNAARSLDWLNTSAHLVTDLLPVANPEAKVSVSGLLEKMYKGYNEGGMTTLLEGRGGVVPMPTAAPAAAEAPKNGTPADWEAIKQAYIKEKPELFKQQVAVRVHEGVTEEDAKALRHVLASKAAQSFSREQRSFLVMELAAIEGALEQTGKGAKPQ